MKRGLADSNNDPNTRLPGPEISPGPWNSFTVACTPPEEPDSPGEADLCFSELVRYYRHSGVGQRCLGIVHQMNTPLQVLAFQLDLLDQKAREELEILAALPPAGAPNLVALSRYRQDKLQQMGKELSRLHHFTQELVTQGMHEDNLERTSLDLNQLFRRELELYVANPFFKHQVTRELHFQEGLPTIFGHYIDFSQSFRNLVDNALEAMEGTTPRHLTVVTFRQGKQLKVRIGDSGTGIPPRNLPRIFDPFFTTKAILPGVRAGLGLFMVRRLLAPYRAEIQVQSIPGETWVTVSLPLA
jgi:signal transduction histidine kinase